MTRREECVMKIYERLKKLNEVYEIYSDEKHKTLNEIESILENYDDEKYKFDED